MESQEIKNVLQRLIGFESTAGHDELYQCADFIEEYFSDTDLIIKRYNHNNVPSVMVLSKDTLHTDVMLQGHFDVVVGGNTDYQMIEKEDQLSGPGALDMKGSVAVIMVVLKNLAQQYPDKVIGAMFNGDEESGGFNSAQYLVEEVGYSTDLLINFDGGYSETISHAEKGIIRLEMIAHESNTTSVHMPWKGGNAIDTLIDAYQKFRELFASKHNATAEDNWHTTYNAWGLSANILQSRTAHEARLKLSIHFVEDKLVDDYLAEIQAAIPEVEFQKLIGAERVYVDKDNPTLLQWKDCMEEVYQKTIPVIGENGSSDARFFTHMNIPIIVTRPAGDDPEGLNEYVSLDSLHKLALTTECFLERICKN